MANEAVEQIPDADQVSRHVDHPHKITDGGELLWQHIFLFSSGVESVVWRRYCPTIEEVHRLGCANQDAKRALGRAATYKGAITSVVEQIRALKSAKGHGFRVEHRPENDQGIHHAEIELAFNAGLAEGAKPPKSEVSELKRMIHGIWGQLEAHECSSTGELQPG